MPVESQLFLTPDKKLMQRRAKINYVRFAIFSSCIIKFLYNKHD